VFDYRGVKVSVRFDPDDTALVLNDDAAPLAASGESSVAGLRLIAGDTVQVEPCDTPTIGGPEASLVVRLWEVSAHA
jgi:hypothetical protein